MKDNNELLNEHKRLTDIELSQMFDDLYDRFPSVRCLTCPEDAHCLGTCSEEGSVD